MQYFTFHDNRLSRVALGCDHYGETVSRDIAWANLDLFFQAGGTILDVAHRYGQTGNDTPSASERTVGAWIKDRSCRNQVFLVTKGGHPDFDDLHKSRLDRRSIERDIQGSLDDLGVECVDLWYFHRDDGSIGADELIDMANELILEKGYARFIGASNWKSGRIDAANRWAASHGRRPFAMSEIQGSLALCTPNQWGDDTLVCMDQAEAAFYRKTKMPVMCFSSQAKGYFSKKIEGGQLSEKALRRFDTPENRALIPLVKRLAGKLGVPAAAISTSYLLSQKDLTLIPIVSASKASQLANTLKGIDLRLDEEQLERLDQARG